MTILVNLDLLESTADFSYLGCTVTFYNSDWAELQGNLRKMLRRWGLMAKLMKKKGEVVWTQAMIYKVAV